MSIPPRYQALLLAALTLYPCARNTADTPKLNISTNAPWGKLAKHQIFLEAPERLVTMFPTPSSTTNWVLAEKDLPKLVELLQKSMLPESIWQPMLGPDRMLKLPDGVALYPAPELLAKMTEADRSAIYTLLAHTPGNEYIQQPLVITTSLDRWVHGTELPAPMQKIVRQMAWTDGHNRYFSDLSSLVASAANRNEITLAMKHMTRTESLLVELEISSESNMSSIQAYWKAGRDRTDAGAILASLVPDEKGNISRISISHLLPPHVRRLLYAYPEMSQGVIGRFPDCHWTSLNFWEASPQEYFIDTTAAGRELANNYDLVTDELRLGDVLLFRNGDAGLHSCVYIAANVVFSKNGGNVAHPWVLCEIEDLFSHYHDIPDLKIDVLRRKMPQ
jgi:hypothetical protein